MTQPSWVFKPSRAVGSKRGQKSAQHRAVRGVPEQRDDQGLAPIMELQEAGRLEDTTRARMVVLARHVGMNIGSEVVAAATTAPDSVYVKSFSVIALRTTKGACSPS